ncbi:ANTAR domain-containing response regulator, partial [Azohydromonas sediminis]|uniref:ANTAR domain-containing response regulator n=1 Tax=Azohydromonas sediminis TaxID=2259674 RepID=UPI001B354559
ARGRRPRAVARRRPAVAVRAAGAARWATPGAGSAARILRTRSVVLSDRPAMAPPDSLAPLRVLLVDDGAHRVSLIRDELTRQGHEVVGVVDSPLVIHDCVTRLAPDVVIVDSQSPSRDTLEHVATLSSRNPRPVVVFAEDDADDPMRRAIAAGVSAYVVAGLQPKRLASVMRVAIARFEQDKALREQLDQARGELKSRKIVERAKGVLMRSGLMTEDSAYRHLRKMAMDRGEKLVDVAQRVIDAHDLLHPRGGR